MRAAFLFLAVLFFPLLASAQEITREPICFTVRNTAPYKVYGSFVTDYFTMPDGSRRRHTSNFRLDAEGDTDPKEGFPTDRAEFCSYGPFYPNRQIEMVLRTLIPIFSCKTSVELGEIVIKGMRKPEPEGGTKTWAECL